MHDLTGLKMLLQLLSSGEEVNTILKRAKAVAAARSSRNMLFNESRFPEASVVYSAIQLCFAMQ